MAETELFVCLISVHNTSEGHIHPSKRSRHWAPPATAQPGKGALAPFQRPQATCGRRGRLLIGARSLAWRAGPPVCPSPHAGRGKGGQAWLWGRDRPAGPNLYAAPRLGRGFSCAGRRATVAGARVARASSPLRAAGAQGGGPQSSRAPPTLRAAGEPEDGGGSGGRPGGGGAEAAVRGSER